tara:strand:- start:1 stop:435 length:435 start_codon:yes stop_codon:yes gene_type:complete
MENKNLKEMSLKDLIMTHYAISKQISNMYAEINKIKKQRTEVHTAILEHADMQKHVENSSATRNNVCDKGDDKLTIKVNNNAVNYNKGNITDVLKKYFDEIGNKDNSNESAEKKADELTEFLFDKDNRIRKEKTVLEWKNKPKK